MLFVAICIRQGEEGMLEGLGSVMAMGWGQHNGYDEDRVMGVLWDRVMGTV